MDAATEALNVIAPLVLVPAAEGSGLISNKN